MSSKDTARLQQEAEDGAIYTNMLPARKSPNGCPSCGNLVKCVCLLREIHSPTCKFLRAAQLSVELACEHGFQACPTCDPCCCGAGATEGIR